MTGMALSYETGGWGRRSRGAGPPGFCSTPCLPLRANLDDNGSIAVIKRSRMRFAAIAAAVVSCSLCSSIHAQEPVPVRSKTGKVEIFKETDLKPGMKG